MKATVTIADGVDDERKERTSQIECTVRLGMQGWGSVELYVERFTIFPGRIGSWRTLAEVLAHPLVTGVTFSGPWVPDRRINVGGYEQPVSRDPLVSFARTRHDADLGAIDDMG